MYGSCIYGNCTYGNASAPIIHPDKAALDDAAAVRAAIPKTEGMSLSERVSVSKRVPAGQVCIGDTCYGDARDTSRMADDLALSESLSNLETVPADRAGRLSDGISIQVTVDRRKTGDSLYSQDQAVIGAVIPLADAVGLSDTLALTVIGLPLASVRDSSRLKPVYLVQIVLKNGGPTLYLSDRNITVGADVYESYMHDLAGIAQELRRADSTAQNVDLELSFRNDRISFGGKDYAHLIELGQSYPFETAVCAIYETAYDTTGFPAQPELVFKGVLDCPQDIDLTGFKCKVSTMPNYMDARWRQTQLETDTFPAATDDVGKYIPIVYGSDILMPALRIEWTKTSLVYAITAFDTGIPLTDTTGFAPSGQVIIDQEIIGYSGIANGMLTGVSRGLGGTIASPHPENADVMPYQAAYDWVLAAHPLQAVGDVFAEIGGKLWLVESGVTSLFEGGYAKLRVGTIITVGPTLDNISVTDTTGIDDGITLSDPAHTHDPSPASASMDDASTNNFPSGAGWQQSVSYMTVPCYFEEPEFTPTKTVFEINISYSIEGNVPFDIIYGVSCADLAAPTGNPGSMTLQFTMGPGIFNTCCAGFTCGGNSTGHGYFYVTSAKRTMYYNQGLSSSYTGVKKVGTVAKTGQVSKYGSIVSTLTVERFHAVVNGYADDAYGTYTGAPYAVIERPDALIKHFLEVSSGIFTREDLNAASFSAAASFYAANGYRLAFCLDKLIKPSQWLSQLARECRSTLVYNCGLWRLNVLPDAAPAPVRTITKDELAGQFGAFVFGKTDWRRTANYIVASYDRQYTTIPGKSQSGWLGTATVQDAASQAMYGIFKKEIKFEAVRTRAMAGSVLSHMLLEAATPLLTVQFDVFWENFDLKTGDTIAIENDFFSGTLFFIEEIKRKDAFRATVKAVGWWG